MQDFFECEENALKTKLDVLLLIECSKLQDLVTPFVSFESIPSIISFYNPIPEIDIVNLVSESTVNTNSAENNTNVSSATLSSPTRIPLTPIQNLYVKKRSRTQAF